MSADTAPAAMPVVSHETASGETQQALCSTDATQAPAAMPGEEDVARALIAHFAEHTGFVTINEDGAKTSVSAWYGGNWIELHVYPMARAALDLFAPILAEKERLRACLAKANKNTEEFERRYYLESDRVEALEARALAAEAALAAAREDAITAYASHIDVAMRKYDDNLHHGDDALGPEFFIEQGMERAAAAIRAQGE